MNILQVDDKWSIEFDPEDNDRPTYWHRNGERHSPFTEHNGVVAMFYALLEARK